MRLALLSMVPSHFARFCNIREIWDSLYESSDFARREQEIQEFNRVNRWRKRGIAMMRLQAALLAVLGVVVLAIGLLGRAIGGGRNALP